MTNILYRVKIHDVDKFEKQNTNISINIIGLEEDNKTIYPLRITKVFRPTHINLLLIQQNNNWHYCLIRDFSKLMFDSTKYKGKQYWCYLCLQRFTTKNILDSHTRFCSQFAPQRVEMSKKKYLKFTNHKFQLKARL